MSPMIIKILMLLHGTQMVAHHDPLLAIRYVPAQLAAQIGLTWATERVGSCPSLETVGALTFV